MNRNVQDERDKLQHRNKKTEPEKIKKTFRAEVRSQSAVKNCFYKDKL